MEAPPQLDNPGPLSISGRCLVLAVVFAGLVFAGFQLGVIPLAALSIAHDLLGESYQGALAGAWFAWHTASLMLGAAIGGLVLGALGDRRGRTAALGVSI